ncbi:hypothetical protein BJ912DRAFT_1041043 [Pholiota molesta]|nr:hypothetical protein BJ912DRAFT_1041043 [Pholiota molesta]
MSTPNASSSSVDASTGTPVSDTDAPAAPAPPSTAPHKPQPHRVLLLLDIQVAMLDPPPIGVPASAAVRTHLAAILTQARAARPRRSSCTCATAATRATRTSPHARLGAHLRAARGRARRRQAQEQRLRRHGARGRRAPHRGDRGGGVPDGLQHPRDVQQCVGKGERGAAHPRAHATYDRIEVLHGGGVTPAWRIEAEIEAELEEAGVHLLEMRDLRGFLWIGRASPRSYGSGGHRPEVMDREGIAQDFVALGGGAEGNADCRVDEVM